jgi:hypothetical protein
MRRAMSPCGPQSKCRRPGNKVRISGVSGPTAGIGKRALFTQIGSSRQTALIQLVRSATLEPRFERPYILCLPRGRIEP